jgi:hypothetical protein
LSARFVLRIELMPIALRVLEVESGVGQARSRSPEWRSRCSHSSTGFEGSGQHEPFNAYALPQQDEAVSNTVTVDER